MNLAQADKVIAEFLASRWTTTPIVWPNVEARNFQVAGHPMLPQGEVDYISIRTAGEGSRTIVLGGGCVRYTGVMYLASCVKEGTGVRLAKERLSDLIVLFENAQLSSQYGTIRMGSISGPIGYPAQGGWYIEEAGFMFTFDRATGA